MFVKLWMKENVITISPEQTLAEAEALMQQHRIRRLLVVKDTTMVGIITKEDLQKGIPTSGDDADHGGVFHHEKSPDSVLLHQGDRKSVV